MFYLYKTVLVLGIELSMSEASYTSHTDPQFRCSDHRPVSTNFATNVVNEKIANFKNIEGWKPIIRFFPTKKDNVPQDWFVNHDGKITYDLEVVAMGSRLLDNWDWIGLYHAEFESLDDYITFTWASACRRPGEMKHATIQDSALYSSGSLCRFSVMPYLGTINFLSIICHHENLIVR